MLVQGLIAAPLLWAGVPPVLVHNLLLLGAIVASAVGIFVLARHITGSAAGAVVAGVIFAFAPYRFEHYMHMELQWTVWIPWAFWALQRTIETRSLRFGLLMGLFVTLQMACSVYHGVFLILLIPAVALPQLIPLPNRDFVRATRALLLGGALAASISWAYSLPYSAAELASARARAMKSKRSVRSHVIIVSQRPPICFTAHPMERHRSGGCFQESSRRCWPSSACCSSPRRPPPSRISSGSSLRSSVPRSQWLLVPAAVRACRRDSRSARGGQGVGVLPSVSRCPRGTRDRRARAADSKTGWRALAALFCAVILLDTRVSPLRLVPYHNEAPPL